MLSEVDRDLVAAAAGVALDKLDVTAVRIGELIDAGSSRSRVMRAKAERRSGDPLNVVIKAVTGSTDGFVRERAALSLISAHRLPGAVRLLGSSHDPPLLVLEDLGDRLSVADLLLVDDPGQAERALVDWAVTVAGLQAASVGLGDRFAAGLAAERWRGDHPPASSEAAPPGPVTDLLGGWLIETAGTLHRLLAPLGLQPGAAAIAELRGVTSALQTSADEHALVAGDTCPDNALYVGERLTLIDFEAAAYRHVAWEAAYLIVPWPTCWCGWAIPDQITERALESWRRTVAPAVPAVSSERFADHLSQTVIAWTIISLSFLLSRALADPAPADPAGPARGRPHPDPRSLVLHHMELAADYPTAVLPALRDLAGEIHHACTARWGRHELQLAPAFRQTNQP